MAIIYRSLFLPNFSPLSPGKLTTTTNKILLHPPIAITYSKGGSIQCNNTLYNTPSINVNYLEREFSGHGVTFEAINDSCVVKMALDDGSVATVMLPSGLITSYKAPMWHGGTLELLHTCVSGATNSSEETEKDEEDDVLIRDGVSLDFPCQSDTERDGDSWSPNTWTLHTIKGDPQEFIQVELVSCSNAVGKIQIKHIATLQQGLLKSEIIISNLKSSHISVMGCLISHLNVSTPEATYVVGLEGSDFYSRPPIFSGFIIIPPLERIKLNKDLNLKEFWGPISELFSMSRGKRQEEGAEGEERDNYKHLTDSMSRIYTSAPRCFTVIDRGKKNSVEVERNGFNEMYMYSHGSTHKWYGKYAYICVGQSALLEPIILAPGGEWRGSQHLRNPNF